MNPNSDAITTPAGEDPVSRRDFLRHSAVGVAATVALGSMTGCAAPGRPRTRTIFAPVTGTPDLIRVGVIGCGGRGTGAAIDCVDAAPNVQITALGDLFEDKLKSSIETLQKDRPDQCAFTPETCFTGFDAYKNVLLANVDLIILAAPPGFRPPHLEAAINAGKHVFMEKPVAVDPVGVRRVIAASDMAAKKGLAIVTGTQRRHDPVYLETMDRIAGGAIGEVVGGQCYWNQGELWVVEKDPAWSDMEWQCRNWLYFDWLSGDHIVEQHVHNIDVMNWAFGGPPVKAVGMGGRQSRIDPKFGNIYDHFCVEFEYANGGRVLSMCRQVQGASTRISEHLVGTRGYANPNGEIRPHRGRRGWKWEWPNPEGAVNPYVQEHRDLLASIRAGRPLNEGRRIAESTLTAIMGRMSAYTGREVSWDWVMNASTLDLTPPVYEFTEVAVRPVPVPGTAELV